VEKDSTVHSTESTTALLYSAEVYAVTELEFALITSAKSCNMPVS
jgi:hypothetical protein